MALVATPEASKGIWGAIKGAFGLMSDTNKAQGVNEVGTLVPIDEYESSMTEEEIISLTAQWKQNYNIYYAPIDQTQQLAFDYWIGKHHSDDVGPSQQNTSNVVDNKIFESLETFLPIATRANPDPLVNADPGEMGQMVAKAIKTALVRLADITKLRRKLARMTRHWALYRVGVAKISWDPILKEIRTDIINARRIIFDKDGYIDEGGHFIGEYIGEKKKTTAERLADLFPKKKADITLKAMGMMGTKLEYYEWWYCGTDVFYTLDDIVLGKYKNPNWNYDIPAKEGTEPELDEQGQVVRPGEQGTDEIPGRNHMKQRQAPYVFLGVFSVGLHPHDETSLILQNISIQDKINRRQKQIDQNVAGMNNGLIVSGKYFTESQAAEAANALRKGQAIRVPEGNVNDAVMRPQIPALPRDVYQDLVDGRNELRAIFGTAGSSPEAMKNEDTVRGKIMVSQQDSSRIGGGITEQLEQVADTIYNWWVQMMFVYYDEPHWLLAAGAMEGNELIQIHNQQMGMLQTLDVTVKEGSLIPKDPLTQRNEAIDLWSANAIDPLTFYKRLDFPDPIQQTEQLILWQLLQKGVIAPQQYLPGFQIPPVQAPMPQEQPGTGGPAVSPPPNSPQPQGASQPNLGSQGAVAAQEKQLIQSVPIPR